MAILSLRQSLSKETLIVMCLASIGLTLPALANGFALIFPDTADYIMLTPRMYRSPFYQAWVFGTGWKLSLWPTVFFQAATVGWLLATFMRLEVGASIRGVAIALLVLCAASSLPTSISYIMPDVFTGAMFVSVYLLIFKWDGMTIPLRVVMAIYACFVISVHLSHLTMAIGMAVACGALILAIRPREFGKAGLLALAAACGVSAALTVTYNTVVFHRVALNPAGSTFLMANMVAQGPARAELQDACPAANYRLCKYSDQLPKSADTFLWGNGILVHLGGFEAMADESSRIVFATLAHRPLAVAGGSLSSTAAALHTFNPTFEIAPTEPFVGKRMRLVYGSPMLHKYHQSRQQQGSYPRQIINVLTYAGLILSFVCIAYLGWRRKGRGLAFFWYVCAAFVGDAFVCATLSGVHDRYQSRVTWLFVLAAVALILDRRKSSSQSHPDASRLPHRLNPASAGFRPLP